MLTEANVTVSLVAGGSAHSAAHEKAPARGPPGLKFLFVVSRPCFPRINVFYDRRS